MKRVKTFLVQLLFDKKIENFPEIHNNKFWNNLVKIGSNQRVIPTIYSKLKQRKLLNKIPLELKEYLSEIYNFNTERNRNLLRESREIEKKLNENEIIAYTSGLGGLFKPGIPIGKMSIGSNGKINFFSDFTQLSYVKITSYKIGREK